MKKRLPIVGAVAAIGLSGLANPAAAAVVLLDFGGTATNVDTAGRTWNSINPSSDDTASPHTLLSTTAGDSGYRLTVSNPPGVTDAVGFNGSNSNGTTAPTGAAAAREYPTTATGDSAYGNTSTFGAGEVEAVRLILSNLNPNERYSLDFFASRTGVSDNRETEYQITGGSAGTAATSLFLNASNNTGTIVGAAGFAPDANNQIVIDVDAGPNNSNGTTLFYYLGVLEINSSPVPEPTSLTAVALGGAALLLRRRRHA